MNDKADAANNPQRSRKAREEPGPEDREHPTQDNFQKIYREKGQIASTIDEAEDALIAAGVPILVRAGMLVQPIVDIVPATNKRKTQVTLLRLLATENVIYLLNKYAAVFMAYSERKKKWVQTDPPEAVAKGLLNRRHWKFPKVAGVITTPTLRPDGTILDKPGYDSATQLWYAPDSELALPAIKEHPTREDAQQALALFEALLEISRSSRLWIYRWLWPLSLPHCCAVPLTLYRCFCSARIRHLAERVIWQM
jgi:putative DNA primase/helicase